MRSGRGDLFVPFTRGGSVSVYLFPFAGGSASAYRPWTGLFGPAFNLRAAQLPGRQDRSAVPAYRDMGEAIDDLAAEVAAAGRAEPYAFFGHSMGGTLAIEVARRLHERGARLPELIGVSATASPAAQPPGFTVADRSDADLARASAGYGGLPAQVLDDAELLALVLPSLRSDLAMLEDYRLPDRSRPPLPVPISAFGGRDDALAGERDLATWRAETSAGCTVRTYPGGHFYLWDHGGAVVDAFRADLDAVLLGAGRPSERSSR